MVNFTAYMQSYYAGVDNGMIADAVRPRLALRLSSLQFETLNVPAAVLLRLKVPISLLQFETIHAPASVKRIEESVSADLTPFVVFTAECSPDLSVTLINSTLTGEGLPLPSAIEFAAEPECLEESVVTEFDVWVDVPLGPEDAGCASAVATFESSTPSIAFKVEDSPRVFTESLPPSAIAPIPVEAEFTEEEFVRAGSLVAVNPDLSFEEDSFEEGVIQFVTPGAHAVALFQGGDPIFKVPEAEVVRISDPPSIAPCTPSVVSSPRPTGLMLGDFETVKALGAGAFGSVHLVQSVATGGLVALKVMKLSKPQHSGDEMADRKAKERNDLGIQEYLAHRRTEGVAGVAQLLGSFYDSENYYFVLVSLVALRMPIIFELMSYVAALLLRWGSHERIVQMWKVARSSCHILRG